MKTHDEIDALYKAQSSHSHGAAIDAVYQAGVADARAADEEAKAYKAAAKAVPSAAAKPVAPPPRPTAPPPPLFTSNTATNTLTGTHTVTSQSIPPKK